MEEVLVAAGIHLEQMHHGDGLASRAVCRRALARGHGNRTGLEDTTVLPDGRQAVDNPELVRVATRLMHLPPPQAKQSITELTLPPKGAIDSTDRGLT